MNKNGYTLIELLVSLSIFAIVMLAATAAYLSFIAYNRQAQTTTSIMNTLSFALDSMAREIRTGNGYGLVGGSGDTSSAFSFANADGCSVEYLLEDEAIVRENTGGPATCPPSAPVTDPSITISNLSFVLEDSDQPFVTIVVNGSACVPNTDCTGAGNIPFDIETSASERIPDL